MSLRIAILPLADRRYDIAFAEMTVANAIASVENAGFTVVGNRALALDAATVRVAIEAFKLQQPDLVLILQATLTDAAMMAAIAACVSGRLAIWAFPEGRTGRHLRLNSLSGLILATHVLATKVLAAHVLAAEGSDPAGWLYLAADAANAGAEIARLAAGKRSIPTILPAAPRGDGAAAQELLADLRGTRIGLIGECPAGPQAGQVRALAGVEIVPLTMTHLLSRAKAAKAIPGLLDDWRERAQELSGIETLAPAEVDKSLALAAALEEIEQDNGLSALAVDCGADAFALYGCAICAPMGFLGEDGTPCACGADVLGALTLMILNALAGEPSWLAKLVEIDAHSNTAVVWQCGSAPLNMADGEQAVAAQVDASRGMALLQEFALKPGRITLARISQIRNETRIVLAGGEVLPAPRSFAGTSGVVRFDRPAGVVLDAMLALGLEHQVVIAYGEHRPALRALADGMGIAVIELT